MRQLIFLLVGLVLAGAIAVTVMDSGKAPPPEHGGRTSDRIGPKQQARMVAGPMALVEKKDMAGAAKAFEADLVRAQAKGGRHAADLLAAYGDQLRNVDREAQAVPYLRRAVAAYRVADPGGPDLALSLTDYAYALVDLNRDNPPPEALAGLREALQIRERVLGRRNAETAISYARLGEWEGSPAVTHRDPAKVAAAAGLIRTAIELLPHTPNAKDNDLRFAYEELTYVYAWNGDVEGTFKAAKDFAAAHPTYAPGALSQVAEIFEKAGDAATGRRLREQFGVPDPVKDDENGEPAAPPTIKNAGKLSGPDF